MTAPSSRRGNRLFDLGLGQVALAFTTGSSKSDQIAIADIFATNGRDGFAATWLRHKGLDWAAELLTAKPDQDQEPIEAAKEVAP
jgi:type IV secretion system protein VirB4